ncbi:MAG TPA: tetratricopeptide repeat protein [Opitutaceae bacterium]|nr:tetratricopeptide repeat protein [Opitutaceae bacterium]
MQATPLKEIALRWLLATGCFVLLIFFFSPPWAAFDLWSRVPELGAMLEVRRASAVLFQVNHLGAEIPDQLHGAIQWRLLFPAIGRALSLPVPVLFGLAHAGCVVALGFIITVLRRNGLGFFASGVAAVILGATSWFFTSVSWLGYFDSWLVLGLLIVAFAESRWSLWAACLWAPWVDERFALAAPLALICRFFYLGPRVAATAWKRDFAVAAGLVVAFAGVRLGILGPRSGNHATVHGYLSQFATLEGSFSRNVFGMWSGMRMAWIYLLLAVLVLRRRRTLAATVLGAGMTLLVGVGLATAQDLSRAMMLVMPVAVLGAIWTNEFKSGWNAVAIGSACAALLLPAHHVMIDRVNPIYYLYHELAVFDSPPPAAMSELHELRGIQAMQRGDLVAAAEALSLAIKLAQNPAGPAKQRGVLFASQQQWAEARKDFSTMVEHAPKDPDGWFLRAQAALAVGDLAAAQADANQALSVAPAGWAERADVARFMARLRQSR